MSLTSFWLLRCLLWREIKYFSSKNRQFWHMFHPRWQRLNDESIGHLAIVDTVMNERSVTLRQKRNEVGLNGFTTYRVNRKNTAHEGLSRPILCPFIDRHSKFRLPPLVTPFHWTRFNFWAENFNIERTRFGKKKGMNCRIAKSILLINCNYCATQFQSFKRPVKSIQR